MPRYIWATASRWLMPPSMSPGCKSTGKRKKDDDSLDAWKGVSSHTHRFWNNINDEVWSVPFQEHQRYQKNSKETKYIHTRNKRTLLQGSCQVCHTCWHHCIAHHDGQAAILWRSHGTELKSIAAEGEGCGTISVFYVCLDMLGSTATSVLEKVFWMDARFNKHGLKDQQGCWTWKMSGKMSVTLVLPLKLYWFFTK